VNRLDVWDNGTYECRAEVASHGNVKLRLVHLEVLCKNFTVYTSSDVTVAARNLVLVSEEMKELNMGMIESSYYSHSSVIINN